MEFIFSFTAVRDFWPFWFFVALFFLAKSMWLAYVQEHFKRKIPWTMFELKIPREIRKSPRAMEQIFMTMHGIRNAPSNIKEKWWEGEVTMWFSCEVASFGGELHLYLRVPEKHRNIIEAGFYAQYSDIEITEVKEDYINRLPSTIKELFAKGYDFFGNELKLAKHDAYPIRSFMDFEENEEDRQLDPFAVLLETLSKIKPQEYLWIQIIIQPVDDSWRKSGEALIKKLKAEVGRRQITTSLGEFVMIDRSPGEIEVMKAVDRNIAKPGFNTIIRYLYIGPKDSLDEGFGRRGVSSSFNQYASTALNKFAHNVKAWTRISFWYYPHIFPKVRKMARKIRIYGDYRIRKIQDETFIGKLAKFKFFDWGFAARREGKMVLSVEELATIFHPPSFAVLTGPLIKRVEARRVGPPAGLPIYGEEGEELPEAKK